MEQEQLLQAALTQLQGAGFEHAQVMLRNNERHELNIHHGEIKLLRTGLEPSLSLSGISDQRKASLSINRVDQQSLDKAVRQLREMADGAQADAAHAIAPQQPRAEFSVGPQQPDRDAMYDRLAEFAAYCSEKYPSIILEECTLDFTHSLSRLRNSNGVDFTESRGIYGFVAMFTAKEGADTSSFNYTGCSMQTLGTPLWQLAYLDDLLRQSAEQVRTRPVPGKFKGPVIIAPHALDEFTGFLFDQIGTGPMVAGTSIFRDKLNTAVASDLVTVHSRPLGKEIADGYNLTADGIRAQDTTLVDHGILRSYLLDIYGANKTGLDRALNDGGCLVMEAGVTPLEELIAGIDEGLLLCRFSGGQPNDKGDFSGVAKNSYYIENGRIAWPVSETMVSGNIAQLLRDIDAVSAERVDFGNEIIPWVRVAGLTVS